MKTLGPENSHARATLEEQDATFFEEQASKQVGRPRNLLLREAERCRGKALWIRSTSKFLWGG